MQKYHKEILQMHFEKLVEDLEPNPVMRYLYGKSIISEEDMDAIRSNDTRYEKNEALLLQLKGKGPDAFKRLVEGLQKNQPSLADLLLKEGKSVIKWRICQIRNFDFFFYLNIFHQCSCMTCSPRGLFLGCTCKKVILAGKLSPI